jgi:hypothetical protein
MFVIGAGDKLTLAQKVNWPRANVLAWAIACGLSGREYLGGASSPEAKQSASTMAGQQNCLEPGWVMAEDCKEDIDDRRVRSRERNAIRIGEEGVVDQLALDGGVCRKITSGHAHDAA